MIPIHNNPNYFGNNTFQDQDYIMEYQDQNNGFENYQHDDKSISDEENIDQYEDKDQSKVNKELTEAWIEEFSLTKSLTHPKVLTISKILNRVYDFSCINLIPTCEHNINRLGLSRFSCINDYTQIDKLIYEPSNKKITEAKLSKEFLQRTLGKNLTDCFISLNKKFLKEDGLEKFLAIFYMAICNPEKTNLILKKIYEECEELSNNSINQKIEIDKKNYFTILESNILENDYINQFRYPEIFLMNDIWNSCLLSRADNDMNSSVINSGIKKYAEFLWHKKLYNKWRVIVLEKFHCITFLLPLPDVNMQIKYLIRKLSLNQPLNEILDTTRLTKSIIGKVDAERVSKRPLDEDHQVAERAPKRLRIQTTNKLEPR